ncbi:hypothetical protein GCM10025857_02130 [Alicyclobacillus contaminans]|nr:hypothetical protein GCM10025857_02130 [Alicyclobacillus contaminans]
MVGPSNAAALVQTKKTISINGHVLSSPYAFVATDGSQQTTYMPIYYVGQALQACGWSVSWNGATRTWTLSSGFALNTSGLSLGTGNATIVVNGQAVKKVNTYTAKDPAGGPQAQATTYLPIYYIQQLLQAAAMNAEWNGWSLAIVAPTSPPSLFGFVTNYGGSQTSLNDLVNHAQVNEFSTFTDSITADGELVGTPLTIPSSVLQRATGYVTVTNLNDTTGEFDTNVLHQVLSTPAAEQALISQLVQLARTTSLGINVDFEMVASNDGPLYTQFMTHLATALHQAGARLSVDVPALTASANAYNYAALGALADEVVIMAYDDSYPGDRRGRLLLSGG